MARSRPPSRKKIQDVYESVRPIWLRRKGVVAVEIGVKTTRDAGGRERSGVEKMTKAQFQERDVDHLVLSIIVYVEAKLDPADLRTNQVFPKEVDGVPIDVQVLPETQLVVGTINPLVGGACVARQGEPGDFGTLTLCVVGATEPAQQVQYLTCAHVAFDGAVGNPVMVQPPGPANGKTIIGTSAFNGITDGLFMQVDAATIAPTPTRIGSRFQTLDGTATITIDRVALAGHKDTIRFTGATTTAGLDGVVVNTNATRKFNYAHFGVIEWGGLLEIEGSKGQAAQGGDSGAVVFRSTSGSRVEVLGMVLGTATSKDGRQLTYAQPFLGSRGSFQNLGVTL